jgi:hypothetical protein
MGCCESDMNVRDDQFHRVPLPYRGGDEFRRGPVPPPNPVRGNFGRSATDVSDADPYNTGPASHREPYHGEGTVYRQGTQTQSTVVRSRPSTPRAGAGAGGGGGRQVSHTDPYHPPHSARSTQYEDDDEMVLICADCGAEVLEFGTPVKCPKTGKLHS